MMRRAGGMRLRMNIMKERMRVLREKSQEMKRRAQNVKAEGGVSPSGSVNSSVAGIGSIQIAILRFVSIPEDDTTESS